MLARAAEPIGSSISTHRSRPDAPPNGWRIAEASEFLVSVASGTTRASKAGSFPLHGSVGIIGRCSRAEYRGPAILVARVGANAGTVSAVDGEYGVTDNTLVLRVNPEFDFEYIRLQLAFRNLNRLTFGSGQPLITGTQVKSLRIPVPPTRREQAQIADAIRDATTSVAALEQLLAKKRCVAFAALEALLTPESNFVRMRLGDVAQIKARIGWQGLTTAEYLESGHHLLVTGTDFCDGRIDWDGCAYVSPERYEQDKYIQLRADDVLVTKDGTIGKVAYVDRLPMSATLNSGVFVVRPLDRAFVPRYFYYILRSKVFARFLRQLSAGSTIGHLYQKDFVDFEFDMPRDSGRQEEIAEVLFCMEQELAAVAARWRKSRRLAEGMMHELLTGRVRLA